MMQSFQPSANKLQERPLDLDSLIQGRRSVRNLLADPVPREVIESSIAAAGWAPSPHGRQPWRFVVLESHDRKLALATAMAASWQEQLGFDGQSDAIVQIRLAKSQQRITTAPTIVIPCLYLADLDTYPDRERMAAEQTMAVQSLGAAIQNLLLSVFAQGFDAGWMCAPLFCPHVVRSVLGLDSTLHPHAMIPVGKAAADPVRRPRRPVADLIAQWS